MWTEWEYGIGGRKTAKNWTSAERGASGNTSVKQMYHRRKNIWRIQQHLVNKGYNIQAANKLMKTPTALTSLLLLSQKPSQKIESATRTMAACIQIFAEFLPT